jgi:hypothetical protein
MSKKLSTEKTREVIRDFSDLIFNRCLTTTPIKQWPTPFRGDKQRGVTRPIVEVPIELLRYRAENKRIIVNVKTYHKQHPELSDEKFSTDMEYQELLGKFLFEKNKKKSQELKDLIRIDGQDTPAVATADGFLIDGNRRRYVIGELHKEFPAEEKYKYMKVVLLPGNDGNSDPEKRVDDGGVPTNIELDHIERILQRRKDGKLDFTDLGEAVTIRDELEIMDFEDWLKLDSYNQDVFGDPKKIQKAKEKIYRQYLGPLDICEDYLRYIGKDGLIEIIEKKGLWNACRDFYQKIWSNIGTAEKAIIKQKEFGLIDLDKDPLMIKKMGYLMMQNPKDLEKDVMYEIREIKKHWLTDRVSIINEINSIENPDVSDPVDPPIKPTDPVDPPIKPTDPVDKDPKKPSLGGLIKKLRGKGEKKDAEEKPKNLLEAVIKKLKHKNLKIDKVNPKDYKRLRSLCSDIQKLANSLEKEIYQRMKDK